MTPEKEFIEFVSIHDLDETEYHLLEEWVNSGHSVYSNPDRFCYRDGNELPYMRWYWILNDNRHPDHIRLIDHRQKTGQEEPASITWYLGEGKFLHGQEALDFLELYVKDLKALCDSAYALQKNIQTELSKINGFNSLMDEVYNISEVIDNIEEVCNLFLLELDLFHHNEAMCVQSGRYITLTEIWDDE